MLQVAGFPWLAMSDYPICLNITGRLCVVVGGGPVGRRKVRGVVEAGARVRLVTLCPPGAELTGVDVVVRPYRAEDLQGAALVFAATGDPEVDSAVRRDAREAGIPINIADAPEEGDFTLPALLRRGDLVLAVSTGGKSPALAAVVRDTIAERFGEEWGAVLAIAAALRQKRLTGGGKIEYNPEVLLHLLAGGLPALIADGDRVGLDRLLTSILGKGCTLEELGIRLPKGTTS
jgi:precorrin-2 dehydrogenase/sirohydrochlorin ferrochelatase